MSEVIVIHILRWANLSRNQERNLEGFRFKTIAQIGFSKSVISVWFPEVLHSFSTASLFLWFASPSHSFIPSEILWTTYIFVSGLCSMELSPDLTPSFQLYICFQICSKDTSFSRPSNLLILTLGQVCVRACVCVNVCLCVCLCVWVREREIVRARACVCVCKCIHRWLLPSPNRYAMRLGLMIRLGALKVFINITLHYIPTQFSWRVAQVKVFPCLTLTVRHILEPNIQYPLYTFNDIQSGKQ